VVVPSFNEGYFPVRYESDILLSAEMRKRLGLPTQLEREELGLYYLMRIAHSAEDTFFVSIKDIGGEIDVMSRYGYLFSPRAPIEAEVRYAYPSRLDAEGSVRLPPTQPSMTHPIREFSRMDIERIKRCETQYYIAKVLRIHDVDKLRKDIEPHLVGQKVHTLFSALYRDIDFSALNDGFLERRLKVLFDEHFSEGFFFTREEDLLKRILIGNLQRAVDRDLDRFRGGYRVCSEFIEKEFTAALGQYTLRGIIDRIDRTPDGSYSIIDYKTGSIPPRKDHLEEAGFKQVQLGFYGLLFQKNFPDAPIEGLSYFDVNRRNDLEKIINSDEMTAYLADFESWLVAFLDVFNTKDVLSLTNDTENCRYCPYPNICRIYEL
jgi:RecB family exonuclease